jgi:ATP-dependent Clp protease ATP-binding subunit ClpA
LAASGFDPVYGARPMRRAIQDKVENLLADKLLSGEIQRGAKVIIGESDV